MNFLALIKLVLEKEKKKRHDEPEQSRDLKSFFHAIDKHQLSMRQLGRERQKKNEGTVTRNYESRGNNGDDLWHRSWRWHEVIRAGSFPG